MPIDTKDQPLNIKDFTISEPAVKKELPFDPVRDITADDWKGMKRELEASSISDSMASSILELFPERRHEIQEQLNNIVAQIEAGRNVPPAIHKIINPRNFVTPMMGPYSFDGLKQKIVNRSIPGMSGANIVARSIYEAFILYPERFSELRHIPQVLPILLSKLNDIRQKISEKGFLSGDDKLPKIAAAIKLFAPQVTLPLDSTDWEHMKKELTDARKHNFWLSFASTASQMRILVAKEVKMTGSGLEFTMPGSFQNEIEPQVPETRKF